MMSLPPGRRQAAASLRAAKTASLDSRLQSTYTQTARSKSRPIPSGSLELMSRTEPTTNSALTVLPLPSLLQAGPSVSARAAFHSAAARRASSTICGARSTPSTSAAPRSRATVLYIPAPHPMSSTRRAELPIFFMLSLMAARTAGISDTVLIQIPEAYSSERSAHSVSFAGFAAFAIAPGTRRSFPDGDFGGERGWHGRQRRCAGRQRTGGETRPASVK
mmetsp:Transcript_14755/g.41555  ORF Transcript_14755/g.41555 Transcript_14755/m.41555 type:complete len:220 (-) Transcript_14755:74-733(-)